MTKARAGIPHDDEAADAMAGLAPERLDRFTHARLWNNPCGFSARFNFVAMRYNLPLYGWVEQTYGLSRVEFVVIYNLAIMDNVTASEIASSTAFPKNTMSRAVNRLIRLGLIRRRPDLADRRNLLLLLTEAGRAIVEEALPRFAGLEEEMLAPLSARERETLFNLMAKVVLGIARSEGTAEAAPDREEAA